MNLFDILEIFDHLRDEQTAAINKAIQMCIKIHSRNGQIVTATGNKSRSLDLTSQKGICIDMSTQTDNDVHKESTRISVDLSQEKSGEDGASMISSNSTQSFDNVPINISSANTPKRSEPMSNTQVLTRACLKSSRVSLSRQDSPTSNRTIEMQNLTPHPTPNKHNSERNDLPRRRGSNDVRKSSISPNNGYLATCSDLSNAVTTNDLNSSSAGNLSSLPSRHSMKAYVNAPAGNSSSRLANTSHNLSDIELSVLLRPDKESIENASSTKEGPKLQTHSGENVESLENSSAMDVVLCLSADTNNDNLSEFSPRINLKSPANNSSLNLSEVASMMSGYGNGLDRLKTLDTNRADTCSSHFTGNSSQAEKNDFFKFLAESTPMALRPVLKTQRILSEGTVMQSQSASIDASTPGSPRSNQFNRTPLIVTNNISVRAARKSSQVTPITQTETIPHASELILDTQLLSKSEALLLQQELTNFTAADFSFASQPIVGSFPKSHASEGDTEFVRMIVGRQTSNDEIACESDQVDNRSDNTNENINDNESVGAGINVSNLCEAAVAQIQQQAEVESNSDNEEGSVIKPSRASLSRHNSPILNRTMDVVYCENLSGDINNDNLIDFSPRINLKSPANNSSLNLSNVASMMSGYANGSDRLKTLDTNRADTVHSHFTGNNSHAKANVFDKFLAESTPMALRPVLKTQQILSEVMQLSFASIDASTLGSRTSNQFNRTKLTVTKNISFRAARKSSRVTPISQTETTSHASELILDTQLLSKSEASLLQQELTNFTAADFSFASQPIVGTFSQSHASEGDTGFVRMIDGSQTSNYAIACESDDVDNKGDNTDDNINKSDNESVGSGINVSNLCEAAVPEIQEVISSSDNEGSVINDQIEQQSVDRENDFLLEENSNKNANRRHMGDWNEDDDTDTENYNKKRKKINATIRTPNRFVCDAKNCVSVFTTRTLLNEHKRTHKDRKLYKCNVCNKSFGYKSHFKKNLRIHNGEKPYNCSVCDKSFSQSSNLTTHMRIHNGEKPYKCSVCDKSFNRSSNLTRHMRIHNGEKPYKCSVCDKSFSQLGHLTTHMRIHNGEKPYNCSVCDKSFNQSSHLSEHMRIHNGEKPYKCSVCDKSFSRSSDLTTHMRIHNGEKPYNCSVCNKSFSQSGSLSYHMKIHTNKNQPNSTKERFFCDYCGKGYINKRSIELHCLTCYKNPKC